MRSAAELTLLALLAITVTACVGGGSGPLGPPVYEEGPWDYLGQRPCPEESFLTWENFGDPFVRNWCTGCHSTSLDETERASAPIGINFNGPDSIKMHIDRMWVRAGDSNRTMPPAGGPGSAERALLGEWLACGAPTRAELEGF